MENNKLKNRAYVHVKDKAYYYTIHQSLFQSLRCISGCLRTRPHHLTLSTFSLFLFTIASQFSVIFTLTLSNLTLTSTVRSLHSTSCPVQSIGQRQAWERSYCNRVDDMCLLHRLTLSCSISWTRLLVSILSILSNHKSTWRKPHQSLRCNNYYSNQKLRIFYYLHFFFLLTCTQKLIF